MSFHKQEMSDKLYGIFHRRLVRIWDKYARDYSIEDRIKVEREWKDYIEGLGGCIEAWGVALRRDQLEELHSERGILFHNPCESPFHNPCESPVSCISSRGSLSPTYILIPNEVALKILMLGELP